MPTLNTIDCLYIFKGSRRLLYFYLKVVIVYCSTFRKLHDNSRYFLHLSSLSRNASFVCVPHRYIQIKKISSLSIFMLAAISHWLLAVMVFRPYKPFPCISSKTHASTGYVSNNSPFQGYLLFDLVLNSLWRATRAGVNGN